MKLHVLTNALAIATAELRNNLTRAMLTALGVLIGVGAVIAMVALGEGATASIEADLSSLGSNLLIISPGAGGAGQMRTQAPALDVRDGVAIAREVPHVAAVAPTSTVPAVFAYGGAEVSSRVYGSTADWFDVMDREVVEGRRPTEGEQRSGAAVCVLGETVREALFGSAVAVGADVRLENLSCEVIGVMEPKGANSMGMDQDDLVMVPLTTVQRRLLGSADVSNVFVSIDDAANLDAAKADITLLMRDRRHISAGSTDDFSITDTREMADMVTGITGLLTAFLGAVAGVSLLVGGIGIMNIMLVSVTERTREIGIRMAVGALEQDVLTQFLVEASLISTLGGFLGIVCGLTGAWAGARWLGVGFVLNVPIALGAVVFSALVGVVFGFYPARRAARMEPIDALRHT
jgi:putative ABC transport system permease protein